MSLTREPHSTDDAAQVSAQQLIRKSSIILSDASLTQSSSVRVVVGRDAGQCQISKPTRAALCTPCIHGDMSFLASNELQGRAAEPVMSIWRRSMPLRSSRASAWSRVVTMAPSCKKPRYPLHCRPISRAGWRGLPRCPEQVRGTSSAFCAARIQLRAKTRFCSPRISTTWGMATQKW